MEGKTEILTLLGGKFCYKCKRTRKLITTDVAQSLQNALDAGKSIREAARMIEISESVVRYVIKRGVTGVNCAKK